MTLAKLGRYDPDAADDLGGRAVVVGGSLAGLCAARVLADAFDEVVVFERDRLPDDAVAREGAPQSGHPHALLEAGRMTLEDLFPGFTEDVAAAGGLIVDGARDFVFYDQGGVLADGPERLPSISASRPLIEQVIRRHARAVDGVDLRDGRRVTGFRSDGDGAVTGVVTAGGGGGGGGGGDGGGGDGGESGTADGEIGTADGVGVGSDTAGGDGSATADGGGDASPLDAAVVVDATGRTSRTPAWLEANGYPAPPVEEVRVDVTYSTVRVERPPTDRRMLGVPPRSPRTRGGAALPVEGDRWEVILQGIHGDEAPTDRESVVAFAESLPLAELGEIVRERTWCSDDVDRYPFPASLRRRYDRLDRFPDGLVVTGDALASFNPIYGQGMSVAALDALALHHVLADGGREDLPRRFFDRVTEVVDPVWRLAVGADFEFPQTAGHKPFGTDAFNRYVARLLRRAHDDGTLRDAFMRVYLLERPPTSLLAPRTLWRVLGPASGD